MPIPKPTKNEARGKFIPRCISALAKEGDRYTNEQRVAICHEQWRNRNKEKGDNNMKLDLDPKKLGPKVSESGTTGTIAGQYDEFPALPEDAVKPKTYVEELEEELRSP